jgi:3D (Asp-Asp-Asp) domain-containing protein
MINIAMILIGLCLTATEPEPVPHRADNCIECQYETTGEVIELGQYVGTFTVTAYCGCSECCGAYAEGRGDVVTGAIGEPLSANYSIAVDPNVIALGSTVTINGQEYKAQDTGGAIQGNRIDMYFDNHAEAVEFGVQYMEVYK